MDVVYTDGYKINERDILKEQRLARLTQVFHRYRLIYSDLDKDQLREDFRGRPMLGRNYQRSLAGDARVL